MNLIDYYNKTYTKRQLEADLTRIDRLRFLFESVPKDLKILDIGCGPGVDVDFLVKAGNEVHGVDVSDEALNQAQIRGIIPHKIDLSQGISFPFKQSSFHLIIATDILEHLFFPKKLLDELFSLIKEKGVLVVSVPNHFYWKMRLSIMLGGDLILPFHSRSEQWDYFHIRFFTSKGYEKLLAEAGFMVIERYYDRFIDAPRKLPQAFRRRLANRFPDLFSMHFIVKAVKGQL